ncbi:hypothetical protein [Ktedonobacter racemifer]|uniref:Uncharacterized protein n=1 Tax=Ktedonobacter racemifer DSM 44963 TaxID=485913 RepID=D6TID7_KTERA|nr:hypothetical protein [Ktedonobacter racemifer]EFH89194.1 hypothetical protein Krac_10736 [Ktedonobacter racemifer DSM 44963]
MMQERYDEAEAALKRALEIDPDYAIAKSNLVVLRTSRRTGPPVRVELNEPLRAASSTNQSLLLRSSNLSMANRKKKATTQLGKQPPRYRFFLNPYQGMR